MDFNLTNALVVTLEGMIIVFAVLIIIMLVLYALKFFAGEEKKPETGKAPVVASAAPTIHTVSDKNAESLEESELIAIFSGAIAGYLDVPVEGISIASYKKIN